MAATKQPGSPKDDDRDIQQQDVADKDKHQHVKTPDNKGDHPPGMGEDEDKGYVPEKERP